jgi:SAM-dependent methyltransferase|tara:strand:+ start:6364 stop:7026 length:663 start_codon:yes stop_codon:yes gene_type:complete
MEEIRKNHNEAKRVLIRSVAREGQHILDVGCGFGGDLQKWHNCGVNINMCDPEPSALEQARERAKNMRMRVNFYEGDIHQCPHRKFDVICFNFSLHYIFASRDLFMSSLREIKKRVKHGTYLVGIIPDSEKIIFKTPLIDDMGNFFKLKDHGNGDFGEKLFVHLTDTPYYADGPKSEPVAYKDQLVTHLEQFGFRLQLWEGLCGNPISELYSKFIFVYDR